MTQNGTRNGVSRENHIYIGGRKSKLAVIQSEITKASILKKYPHLTCSILALSTLGDQVQNKPLYTFGGKALWTRELENLLLVASDPYPKIDLIVHSLKDMPTHLPDEFELGCVLEREDPRDAVVMKQGSPYKSLAELPDGSVVGTSSVRRTAQLLKNYPNLKFESVRGNVQTRLSKLDAVEGPFSCLLLASAGLIRLGLGSRISSCMDSPDMYYAVGQGALGIEIRKGDAKVLEILKSIEHLPTTYCCLAERSLMRTLEGGCSVPIGVNTTFDEETSVLKMKGIVISPDGQEFIEDEAEVVLGARDDAEDLGIKLAKKLVNKGAKKILDDINFDRIHELPNSNFNSENVTPSSSIIL